MPLRNAFCLFALFSAPIGAAGAAVQPFAVSADNPFLVHIRAGLSAKDFAASALRPFDDVAGKTGVITAQALRERQAVQDAPRRANTIAAVLRFDLDNDLRVTAGEILTAHAIAAPQAHPARTKKISARAECDRLILKYDSNSDGAIDVMELAQAALPEDRSSRSEPLLALLESDLGKDGKLTRKEMKAFAQRTFNAIDTNKDGRISSEEYAALPAPPL